MPQQLQCLCLFSQLPQSGTAMYSRPTFFFMYLQSSNFGGASWHNCTSARAQDHQLITIYMKRNTAPYLLYCCLAVMQVLQQTSFLYHPPLLTSTSQLDVHSINTFLFFSLQNQKIIITFFSVFSIKPLCISNSQSQILWFMGSQINTCQVNTNLSPSKVLHLGQLEGDHILHVHLSTSQLSDYQIKKIKLSIVRNEWHI